MREIKFRAWHIGKKEMVTPASVMFCPNEIREWRVFSASDGEFLGNDKHYEVMQYTGLKDKNGVEIYEGDILQCGGDNSVTNRKAVTWRKSPTGIGWNIGTWYVDPKRTVKKVIGNIYENPELLK